MLMNQNIPTGRCPSCDNGKIYTRERSNNALVNGKQVCTDCAYRHILNTILNRRAD